MIIHEPYGIEHLYEPQPHERFRVIPGRDNRVWASAWLAMSLSTVSGPYGV